MAKTTTAKKETALVPPREEAEWEKALRAKAKATKSALTVGVPRITHKGGILKIDGARVKDNRLAVIVLGMIWTKAYYENEYTEGSTETPVCYAFGEKESGLTPHAAAPKKQNATCDGCPHNAFGTAEKGRGKRCGDKPRLLVLLASDLERNGERDAGGVLKKAQHYQIDVPPTSLVGKGAQGTCLNAHVAAVAEQSAHGDMMEVITEISTEARENGGYFVTFGILGPTPPEALPVLVERSAGVAAVLSQPFPVVSQDEEKQDNRPVKGQDNKKARK